MLILSLLLGCGDKSEDTSAPANTAEETDVTPVNAGPDGPSYAQNDCGPTDGTIYVVNVGSDAAECGSMVGLDWSVVFTIYQSSIVSGQEFTVDPDETFGTKASFNYNMEKLATDGYIRLEFEGEWKDGTSYTGYYTISGDEVPLIEGSFEGVVCISDLQCG